MASKQLEEIQRKLRHLSYPRADATAQSFLFAGGERYSLLEWLFFKLLGGKSPFPQCSWHGDGTDQDEETTRIQYLAGIAYFLGITTTLDGKTIQGCGSYESRAELLYSVIELVEASCFSDNPDWSIDEQVAKDIRLLDACAEQQAQIFCEDFKLFPADVQIYSTFQVPDIYELESKLDEYSEKLLNIHKMIQEITSTCVYNPDEEYDDVQCLLNAQLGAFLETARSFDMIYNKEIRTWANMMETPQLHGLGPAASRLLEAYRTLTKLLTSLKTLRNSYKLLSSGSETADQESWSIRRLISECESAMTFLNRDLRVLSASIARIQNEKAKPEF